MSAYFHIQKNKTKIAFASLLPGLELVLQMYQCQSTAAHHGHGMVVLHWEDWPLPAAVPAKTFETKGRPHKEKHVFFRALPKLGYQMSEMSTISHKLTSYALSD